MTDKLTQYRSALRYIGDQRLAALTENIKARYSLDDVWDSSVRYMLEQANWKFALRVVRLDPDPDTTPTFGFPYAYSKPSDMRRLAHISPDEFFRLEVRDFDDHDGFWWAQANPLFIKYVSDDESHGYNLAGWPPNFAKAHAQFMASECGLDITKSGGDAAALLNDHVRTLERSKTLDAIGNPVFAKPRGSWVNARMGGDTSPERDGSQPFE